MSWRVALSLLTLRDQLDAAYPTRSKASDGTIGDAAHAASVSDHNPDAAGIVRALDITHDPAHGCDIDRLSDELVVSRDERISYLIANRMISGPEYGWVWSAYYGDDPHTGHLHLSVVADSRADSVRPWSIGAEATAPSTGRSDRMPILLDDKSGPTIILTNWEWTESPCYDDCLALKAAGVPMATVTPGLINAAMTLPRPGAALGASVTITDVQVDRLGDRIGAVIAASGTLSRADVAAAVETAMRQVLGAVDGATP